MKGKEQENHLESGRKHPFSRKKRERFRTVIERRVDDAGKKRESGLSYHHGQVVMSAATWDFLFASGGGC